jgi:Tol biopolymer transport system component
MNPNIINGYDIYIMNANGTEQIRLTNDSASNVSPVFSPNGKKIAFESYRTGNIDYELYLMNTDGTEQVKMTTNNVAERYPSWSN